MDLIILFGTLGAIFSIATLIPEISLALRTHRLNDLSWGMVILTIFNYASWFTYGILIGAYPIIYSAGIDLLLSLVLFSLKVQYTRTGQPVAVTIKKKKYADRTRKTK